MSDHALVETICEITSGSKNIGTKRCYCIDKRLLNVISFKEILNSMLEVEEIKDHKEFIRVLKRCDNEFCGLVNCGEAGEEVIDSWIEVMSKPRESSMNVSILGRKIKKAENIANGICEKI